MTIRIDEALKQRAELEARILKRSIGKQIEYWAEVGELVCSQLSAENIRFLRLGQVRVVVQVATTAPTPTMDEVLTRLGARNDSGELRDAIQAQQFVVESDPERVGGVRVVSHGSVVQGDWIEGRFVPSHSAPAFPKEEYERSVGRPADHRESSKPSKIGRAAQTNSRSRSAK